MNMHKLILLILLFPWIAMAQHHPAVCGLSNTPSWCAGSDIGAWTNAAIADSSLTTPSTVVIDPGTYNITTPIVIDRPITLVATGAMLKPQSGGASGVWGSAPVTLTGRTLTTGTSAITVASCTGITPGSRQVAIGGVGLPPDDYIASCSGTTATLVLPPALTIFGSPISSSNQLCGVPNIDGLADGQTLNGTGISGLTISSINVSTNCITLSGNATVTATSPQSYMVTGTVTSTLTAQVVAPVVSLVYNTSALRNEWYQNVGASIQDLWIQDPAASAGNAGYSITGVQGVQINGWDRLVINNYEADGLMGAGLILSGFTGVNTGNPVRESNFDNVRLRTNGNWASGQSALIIGNQDYTGNDQINQIGFKSLQDVSPDGIAVDILSYASSVVPRMIWFNGPNGQLEKGSALANLANLSGPGPVVNIRAVDDVYFDNTEINSAGYGSSDINIEAANTVTVDHSRIMPGTDSYTYTVGVTNGSPTVSLVSGYTYQFDDSGKWNGDAAWLVDGTTCTNASPCLAYISSVGSTTSLTLASNYTGTTNSTTATMTLVNSSVYFAQSGSSQVGGLTLIGDELVDPSNLSSPTVVPYSVFGFSSVSATNLLLTGTQWSGNYTISDYDQRSYYSTPLSFAGVGPCWNNNAALWYYGGGISFSTSCTTPNDNGTAIGAYALFGSFTGFSSANNFNLVPNALPGNAGEVSRNVADANPAFTIKQANSSSTGDILDTANSSGIQSRFLQQGNLLLSQSGSQPTCSSTIEGAIWYTKGSGSGNGSFQICQDQSGTYEWVTH